MNETDMSILKMMCLAVVEAYNAEGQMKPQTIQRAWDGFTEAMALELGIRS